MSSWQGEQGCLCYQFLLIDGKGEFRQLIDHDYSLKVRLKGSEEIMNFRKKIKSNSTVIHELKDWAAVNSGSVDDLLADKPAVTNRDEGMAWLQGHGFSGGYGSMSVTVENNGGTLTFATSMNTWDGTIDESIAATYGGVDFANINLDAAHVTKETTTAEASAGSSLPMGYRQVPSNTGDGWGVKWFDYVAFVDYLVTGRTTYEDVLKVSGIEFRTTTAGTETSSTINISDSVIPYGSDVRYWEPVYPPTDPESDGRQLGFSHWLFNLVTPSRWEWFRDMVDDIYLGAEVVGLPNVAKIIGNWTGSIAKSRVVDEKQYLMLSSDKVDTKLYEYKNGALTEIEKPKGLEDKTYPICPL